MNRREALLVVLTGAALAPAGVNAVLAFQSTPKHPPLVEIPRAPSDHGFWRGEQVQAALECGREKYGEGVWVQMPKSPADVKGLW